MYPPVNITAPTSSTSGLREDMSMIPLLAFTSLPPRCAGDLRTACDNAPHRHTDTNTKIIN